MEWSKEFSRRFQVMFTLSTKEIVEIFTHDVNLLEEEIRLVDQQRKQNQQAIEKTADMSKLSGMLQDLSKHLYQVYWACEQMSRGEHYGLAGSGVPEPVSQLMGHSTFIKKIKVAVDRLHSQFGSEDRLLESVRSNLLKYQQALQEYERAPTNHSERTMRTWFQEIAKTIWTVIDHFKLSSDNVQAIMQSLVLLHQLLTHIKTNAEEWKADPIFQSSNAEVFAQLLQELDKAMRVLEQLAEDEDFLKVTEIKIQKIQRESARNLKRLLQL